MARNGANPPIRSSQRIAMRRRVVLRRQLEFDPPVEILELILSRLSSRDKARASAVCKEWKDAVTSVWKKSSSRAPVLMSLDNGVGNHPSSFQYLNLSLRTMSPMELPNIPSGHVCHANYGWILFVAPFTARMTFFHPETQKSLPLPKLKFHTFNGAAFSGPPTSSSSCIVFTMHNPTSTTAEIFTWRPGHTEWTAVRAQSSQDFESCLWHCVVVRNGCFHCLSTSGRIGVYDPERRRWGVADIQPLKFITSISGIDLRQRVYMAEYNGDIFVLRTCRVVRPAIYKVEEREKRWVKVDRIGGATFFVHPVNSLMRSDLAGVGPERDYIYYPSITSSGKSWVYYSLRHRMYNICQQEFDPARLKRRENIWIDINSPTRKML